MSKQLNDWASHSFSSADESELRFLRILGSVYLRSESSDFSADWEWIPLADFASCLQRISERLACGSKTEKFEFTESDAFLVFENLKNCIRITSSYSNGTIDVMQSEFRASICEFSQKLKAEVESIQPALKHNKNFQNLVGF